MPTSASPPPVFRRSSAATGSPTGRDWFADWRARRIRRLLGTSDHHTSASFAAMQVDATSQFARDLLPRLTRVPPADARSRTALSLLAVWDGTMAREKPQPLIFNAWMRQFRRALLDGAGVADNAAVAGWEMIAAAIAREAKNEPSLCGGPCDKLLAGSLAAAVTELSASRGSNIPDWRWGDVHVAVFAHPLFAALPVLHALGESRIAVSGDDTTLLRAGMRGNSFEAVHGAGFRGVYDLADLDASRFMVTPGQSGNFASPLAWNFVRSWRDGGTIALDATPGTVAFRFRLNPENAPE
jgi:penicillin amidase